MSVKTMSSREFNQAASRAKQAAKRGPVFITDRGRTTHVLLSIDEYTRMSGSCRSIGDMLSDPAAAEIEFDPPRLNFIAREVDFD
jgi:prevent-host-death family protein